MQPYLIRCPACGRTERLRPTDLLHRMQQAGMLRRTADPDPELVRELVRSAAARWRCVHCDREGLTAEEVDEDDEWDEARACRECGQPIPQERLEVFPGAERCAACEQAISQQSTAEAEYCPRCGTPMQLRNRHERGMSRYVWSCPQCRR